MSKRQQDKRLKKLRRQFKEDLAKSLDNAERLRKLRGLSDEEWAEAVEQDAQEVLSAA